ncbi:MAG TPA: Uma2 family endonuclease, partial [Candidatus Ozemobacteraceae bacterium]|nr:Uma2 family endonuclease [Candidatus Ozemobacteraceae bacterium]
MANPLTVANRTWTYADLLKLPEEQRCEIIDGEYFDMTPAPNRLHQEILGNLFRQIINQLDGKPCKVYFAPFDVRLPDSDDQPDGEIRNVVQPDLVVICDEKKLDDRGCRGAPDLAVEILSPSTAGKDQVKKRRLYER